MLAGLPLAVAVVLPLALFHSSKWIRANCYLFLMDQSRISEANEEYALAILREGKETKEMPPGEYRRLLSGMKCFGWARVNDSTMVAEMEDDASNEMAYIVIVDGARIARIGTHNLG